MAGRGDGSIPGRTPIPEAHHAGQDPLADHLRMRPHCGSGSVGEQGDERGGFAKRLAGKECTECWRAKQGAASQRLSAEEWLAQRRAEERAETQEWEQRAETWLLAGSEQAGDSGRRFAVLSAANEAVVVNGDLADGEYVELIERPGRLLDRASWWVDIRGHEPGGVREPVEAAQATRATSSKNDY